MIDDKIRAELIGRAKKGDQSVLRSREFKSLADQIKTIPADKRPEYGKELNKLRGELE